MAVTHHRSAVGGRSLFYGRDARSAWMTARTLGAFERAERRAIDHPALARFTAGRMEATSRTLLAGVSRLMPCQSVVLADAAAEVREFVPEALPDREIRSSLGELALRLRAHLERVVAEAWRGCELGGVLVGGLDSCGVAAVALSMGLPTVLVTFDFQGVDPDAPYVRALAERHGAKLIELKVSSVEDEVGSTLLIDDLPHPAASTAYTLRAAEVLRELGADRMFSGALGDDLLGGSCGMIGTRVMRTSPLRALQLAARLRVPGAPTRRERLVEFLLRPNLRRLVPASVRARRRRRLVDARFGWTTPQFQDLLEPSARVHELAVDESNDAQSLLDAYATSIVFADIADAGEAVSVHSHLPRTDVLADPELVRFTASLPFAVLNCDGYHRGLFRRALADLLPARVRERVEKSDGETPLVPLVRRALDKPRFRRLRRLPELSALGWVSGAAFERRIERVESAFDVALVWPFLSAEAFLQGRG